MNHLIVQCNECGQWNALDTNNIQKAKLKCKRCGHSAMLKNKKGNNLNFKESDPIYRDYHIRLMNGKEGGI